jgi:hypothetical protein
VGSFQTLNGDAEAEPSGRLCPWGRRIDETDPVRRDDASGRKLMRRINLPVVVSAMILVGSWTRAAQASYEVATFSTTEQFYDDESLLNNPEPLGLYTDSDFS